jgi:parallel beta-helix repeat protein
MWPGHDRPGRSRRWRLPLILIAAFCFAATAPSAGQAGGGAVVDGASANPPTPINADVTSLVPTTITLATPTLCGDITVYDQEDLSTLCSPTTLASTPITLSTCPQVVSGSVRLETDITCVNSTALIVGSDNTVIDLNGHKISCSGEPGGYFGSCQSTINDDYGVWTNSHNNVHVFSHVPGGTITGFDMGVRVESSQNVKVKQLTVTGPPGAPGFPRPLTVGVFVVNSSCSQVRVGGGTATANDISNATRGIQVQDSSCDYVGSNRVHDIRDYRNLAARALGISLVRAPNNQVRDNIVTNSGDNEPQDAAIDLRALAAQTTGNLIVGNTADGNLGNGIAMRQSASGNDIVNNEMINNTQFDAYSDQSGVNTWNNNNRCHTQTTPQPPPGVCNPGE